MKLVNKLNFSWSDFWLLLFHRWNESKIIRSNCNRVGFVDFALTIFLLKIYQLNLHHLILMICLLLLHNRRCNVFPEFLPDWMSLDCVWCRHIDQNCQNPMCYPLKFLTGSLSKNRALKEVFFLNICYDSFALVIAKVDCYNLLWIAHSSLRSSDFSKYARWSLQTSSFWITQ